MKRLLRSTLCAMTLAAGATTADATDVCRALSENMLRALLKGDYAGATVHFNAAMKASLSAQQLDGLWQQALPQKMGSFNHAAAVQSRQINGDAVAETPLQFANGWLTMRIACDASGAISGLHFLPGGGPADASTHTHVDASGAIDEPLAVTSPFGPLPGTLLLPPGGGPFAVVLLVAGSGPHDRDESIGPNKPFRDIAESLAAAGIASFRYEKRTYVYGAAMAADKAVTVDDEVTDDALTALQLLRKQPQLDERRIFVLGHSLGALMAPRIGQRDAHVAGLILLAAPATFDLNTVLRQIRYIGKVQGLPAEALSAQSAPVVQARDAIATADPRHPPAGAFFHAPASYWLSLRDYNAVTVAQDLRTPMLVLQGGGDYQVTPENDFALWRKGFIDSRRVTLREYPGLSHLFMPAGHPPSPMDYDRAGHVQTQVVQDIVAWLKAQPPSI